MIPLQTGLLSSPCQLHPGSIFYISPREQQFIIGESFLFVLKVWFHDNRASALLFLCERQIFDAGISVIVFESPLMVAVFVCEYNKQVQYKKKKSHLKVPPFMYCQPQRHLPQIRHERLELGELLLCAAWASEVCVLRARRIISYRQRGANPPTSHLPTPDPHLYASPGVKAPTEVTLITGLGRAPLQRHSRRLAEIPGHDSVWKMCPLLTRYWALSGLDNNDKVTALPERHFGNSAHRTSSDNVSKSFLCLKMNCAIPKFRSHDNNIICWI